MSDSSRVHAGSGERDRVDAASAPAALPGPHPTGAVVEWPRIWLRLEGLAAFIAGSWVFLALGGGIVWLVILLVLVDLSMAGYLIGSHPGAILYNVAHNWFTALVVIGLGAAVNAEGLVAFGFVLVAHVGLDRLLGFGLKYAPSFSDTHLGWLGRR